MDDASPIHELVEAQAVRTPDAIAVIAGDVTLTYAALIRRARQLGHALRARGVGPEDRIGVRCARTADLVVAVLGVLQAGAAYVPIDPAWPAARADLVRGDAGLRAIVGEDVAVDQPARSARRLDAAVTSASACCVLYTSGSTGRPKGVVIEHGAIANRLAWAEETYPYAPGEIAAARTPLGFVDSIAELFAPLACGVPLVVLDQDLAGLVDALAAARATRVVVVPSMLATLLAMHPDLGARLPALRWWFVGGEAVPVAVVRAFFRAAPGRKLVNIYGATEVSGDATAYDFDDLPIDAVHAPIGRALRRCRAEIVDGEIVVSGACVARGYLGQPGFGGRYRTGDLGRVLPTGDLECLGRRDAQVKIAGVRVELGEVEALIAAVPGVERVAALARDGALVAFYTGVVPELRAALIARAPAHLVPSRLVALGELPRNVSGKIDRRALEAWPLDAGGAPPRDDRERAVAAIWEEALGIGPIGRERTFHELGGTSLAAVRIAVAIRERLAAPVALAAIEAHPTIAALAAHVATLARVAARPLARAGTPLPAELPLADHQAPFWWFRLLTGDVSVVADVFDVAPDVTPAQLAAALTTAAASFDALWMSLPRWRPVQRLRPRATVPLPIRRAADLQAEVDAVTTTPFDLSRPPLLHARLVVLPDGAQRLILVVPHVVADMAAMELLRTAINVTLASCGTVNRNSGSCGAVNRNSGSCGAVNRNSANLADLVAWQRGRDPDEDAGYWRGGASWARMPARLFGARGARAWATAEIAPALEARLRRRRESLAVTLIAAVHAAITRVGVVDPPMLVMVEHRDRPELAGLFTTLASLLPCRVRSSDDLDALAAAIGRAILEGREHADVIMRRPTWFHDGWPGAMRGPARLASAIAARLWPTLDREVIGEYLRAIVPWPRASRGDRDVLVCVNVLPEVTQPGPPGALTARRALPQMLRPDDLVVGKDPLLARTLQVHVTRAPGLAIHLYGGALAPAALDEIAAHVASALDALAATGEDRRT